MDLTPEIFERVVRSKSDLATVLTITPTVWFLEGGFDVIDWSGPSPVALMAGAGALGLKNTIELAWMGLKYIRDRRRLYRRKARRRLEKERYIKQLSADEYQQRRNELFGDNNES